MLHWWCLKLPPCFLPVSRLKKSLSGWERYDPTRSEDCKTWKIKIKSSPPSLLPRTTPIPTSSAIRKRRSWSTKLRVNLGRSEIRRANQVKVRALPTFSDSRILSRNLMFYDKIVVKTDVLTTVSTIFIFLLLLLPSGEEEEQHHYLQEQEVWGQGILEKLGRLLPRICLIYRWRYHIVSYSNS